MDAHTTGCDLRSVAEPSFTATNVGNIRERARHLELDGGPEGVAYCEAEQGSALTVCADHGLALILH